jgi:hypothetical protein
MMRPPVDEEQWTHDEDERDDEVHSGLTRLGCSDKLIPSCLLPRRWDSKPESWLAQAGWVVESGNGRMATRCAYTG